MPADRFDIVHARLLRFFPELVRQLGGDPDALLAASAIDPERFVREEVQPTYTQTIALIEQAARQLDCADFGMRLAQRQGGAVFGPLGLVMKNSRTFGEALTYVGSHAYAHSLAARIWQRRLADGSGVFSGHDILVNGFHDRTQAIEHIMLAGALMAQEITGGHARVRRVHFRHQPLSPLKSYRRYFGCEVRFDQDEDGVLYFEQDLACPVVRSNPEAFRSAVEAIEGGFPRQSPPVHAQVRGVILEGLRHGRCGNGQVAAALNLHPRTLHRRLSDEGTSFRRVKDEVRRDALLHYLQRTSLDLTTISEKLGFAEQSVLTRRCRHWFAATPTQVRMRAAGRAPPGVDLSRSPS